ncbi:hypothetical protein Vretimale_5720 [Volvox reticuliferus]|uniref:C2H2-type domain-containing protein n=1 Tax=Volvox reticuliferus TaxID=1737510 RepID=A0A8J4LKU8_9CHLO|nr:hypothetical protein Vretifemale_5809 [Volvox reticuliferus]GIM00793.1 hypothetical protein Vretimale_5720 [Volvox reticuliferus]
MVWFHCDDCGDTIKKPKLVSHYRNCSASGFSCVDCLQTFTRATVNSHTTCVTEHEKYALAATKPGGFAAGGLSANREGGPTAGVPSEPTGLEFLSTRPPWRCSVCNVNCTSRETLVNHAAGAKHKRRARAALAAANGCNKVPGSNANVANGGGVSTGAAGVGAPAVSAATAGKPRMSPSSSSSSSSSDGSSSSDDDEKAGNREPPVKRQASGGGATPAATAKGNGKLTKRSSSSSSSSDSDSDSDLPAAKKGKTEPAAKRPAPQPVLALSDSSSSSSSEDDSDSDDGPTKRVAVQKGGGAAGTTDNLDLSLQDAKKFARLTKAVREALERKAEVGRSVLLRLVHTHLLAGSEVEVTDVELQRVRQQLVAKGVCELVRDIRLTKPKKAAAKKVGK